MKNFNYRLYLNLKENELLQIELNNQNQPLFVKRVSKRLLQAYQPTSTPITSINLIVVKDLELYKNEPDNQENFYTLSVEPEQVTAHKTLRFIRAES